MSYKIFRNDLGVVDAIATTQGASLLFDPETKTFDENDVLTIELRSWEAENGKLDLSDRQPDPLTLEQAKEQKKQEIIAIAAAKQEELVAGFAPPEQASWSRKVIEAKALLASGLIIDAPMLRVEAIALSEAKDDKVILKYSKGLAAKILQKSEEMYLNSAAIAGTRTRLLGEAEGAITFEKIAEVNWS